MLVLFILQSSTVVLFLFSSEPPALLPDSRVRSVRIPILSPGSAELLLLLLLQRSTLPQFLDRAPGRAQPAPPSYRRPCGTGEREVSVFFGQVLLDCCWPTSSGGGPTIGRLLAGNPTRWERGFPGFSPGFFPGWGPLGIFQLGA